LKTRATLLLALSLLLPLSDGRAEASTTDGSKKTLAIAVLAGENLDLVRIGALVFGNKRTSVPLKDDTFELAIASAIVDQINAEGQYSTKIISTPQAKRAETRKAIQDSIGGAFTQSIRNPTQELVSLAQSCECESLLVVLGASITDGPNSNQRFGPIAWTGYTGLGGPPTSTALWLPLQYLLIDPSSIKLLESARSSNESYDPFVSESVNAKLWQESMQDVSLEAWSELQLAAQRLLVKSSRLPLFQLGLRPSCGIKFHVRRRVRGEPVPEPTLPPGAEASKCP
jgi:hypothetical protein